MPNGEDITTKYNLDISGFKKGITEANKNIKLANAEFKAASAGMDDWSKSSEGIKAKLKQLGTELVEQNKKLNNYKKQQEEVEKAYRENGKTADELKNKLNQLASNGISKTSEEYKRYEKALNEVEKEMAGNKKASDDLKITILNQQGAVNKAEKEIKKYEESLKDVEKAEKLASKSGKSVEESLKEIAQEADQAKEKVNSLAEKLTSGLVTGLKGVVTAGAGAIAAFLATGEASQETMEDMGKLEAAFETAGHTNEQAQKTYKQFVGILGETDQAVEAVNHLAKLTKSEKELAKWSSIATGIYATFGDSLAIEGLTESANETAKVGKVTGSLADALNWTTMSNDKWNEVLGKGSKQQKAFSKAIKEGLPIEDAFSAALSKTTSEQERATLITDALNALYWEAGENYRKVNGDLIMAREAQAELTNATAEMGRIATPIVNEIKFAFAEFLKEITPKVKEFVEKINWKEFGNKVKEALNKVVDVFKWLIDNKDTLIAVISGFVAAFVASKIISFGTAILGVVKAITAVAKVQGIWNALMTANPIGLIVTAIGLLVTGIVLLIKNWDTVKEVALKCWEGIQQAWKAAGEWFSSKVVEPIKTFFSNAGEYIKTKFTEAKNNVTNAWKSVTEWFSSNVIEPVKTFFTNAGNFIVEKFTQAKEGITKIWVTISTWFSANVIEPIKAFFQPLVNWYIQLFSSIRDFIVSVWEVIRVLAQGVVESIKIIWGIVATWFNENVTQPVKEFFVNLWNAIKNAAQTAWNFISEVWSVVVSWFNETIIIPLTEFFTNLWNGIKNAAQNAWSGIKEIWAIVTNWFNTTIVNPVKTAFSNLWTNVKTAAKDAWEGVKTTFGNVSEWFRTKFTEAWTAVKNVFSTGGKIFDGIKDGILNGLKTVVNAIIRGINKIISVPFNGINDALGKIRDINIAGAKPFSGLPTISVPQIPELEWGGYAKKGHQYLLEGKGDEYVVPLHKNKYWIKKVADQLKNDLFGVTTVPGINANIPNGKSIINNFTQNINSPKPLSRQEIYRQTENALARVQRA